MVRILLFAVAFLVSFTLSGQDIKVYNFDTFQPRLQEKSDSLYVINFWATWCVPCVKEMPAFNKAEQQFSNKKVKILLVSLDMPKHIDSRLIPFLEKHNVTSEVVLLDDPDFNSWIDKVDPQWGGGIPATLIYNRKSRSFYEQSFEYDELSDIINTKLNEL